MPGAAVFSGLQFQEYNAGEVNTKHKKGHLSFHYHLRYFEGYTKSSILTLDTSQYLLSPLLSSFPYMIFFKGADQKETIEDPGWLV